VERSANRSSPPEVVVEAAELGFEVSGHRRGGMGVRRQLELGRVRRGVVTRVVDSIVRMSI
jgi:hypothetical protein